MCVCLGISFKKCVYITIAFLIVFCLQYCFFQIIALSIEGRRSTNHRRRPNTASYSKVETDDGSTVY